MKNLNSMEVLLANAIRGSIKSERYKADIVKVNINEEEKNIKIFAKIVDLFEMGTEVNDLEINVGTAEEKIIEIVDKLHMNDDEVLRIAKSIIG